MIIITRERLTANKSNLHVFFLFTCEELSSAPSVWSWSEVTVVFAFLTPLPHDDQTPASVLFHLWWSLSQKTNWHEYSRIFQFWRGMILVSSVVTHHPLVLWNLCISAKQTYYIIYTMKYMVYKAIMNGTGSKYICCSVMIHSDLSGGWDRSASCPQSPN